MPRQPEACRQPSLAGHKFGKQVLVLLCSPTNHRLKEDSFAPLPRRLGSKVAHLAGTNDTPQGKSAGYVHDPASLDLCRLNHGVGGEAIADRGGRRGSFDRSMRNWTDSMRNWTDIVISTSPGGGPRRPAIISKLSWSPTDSQLTIRFLPDRQMQVHSSLNLRPRSPGHHGR